MIEDWSTYLWGFTIIISCLFLFKILFGDIIRTDAKHESEPDLGNTVALATVFTTAYTKTRSWNGKRRWKIKWVEKAEKKPFQPRTVASAGRWKCGNVEVAWPEDSRWRDTRTGVPIGWGIVCAHAHDRVADTRTRCVIGSLVSSAAAISAAADNGS